MPQIPRPKSTDRETTWSKWIAQQKSGLAEVKSFCSARADVVTDDYAFEVEWLKKYKEAPGQALLYSALLQKKPGIILLAKDEPLDRTYYLRSVIICQRAGIYLEVVDTTKEHGENYHDLLLCMRDEDIGPDGLLAMDRHV